jgi:uncharacterized protein
MTFKIELEPCIPPLWATNGHTQTIAAHLLPTRGTPLDGRELNVDLGDGDTLTSTHYAGSSNFVVALFHGLSGSTESGYMRRTAFTAANMGHTVVAVNHRGCGSGRGLARLPHHSGRGDDLSKVIDQLRQTYKSKKIIAIGFSLGANALLTLVSGLRGHTKPDFAVAVNAPIDLAAASERLKTGLNRIYDLNFVQSCRKEIFFLRDQKLIEFLDVIPRRSNLYDIDRLFTAPFGGFKNPEDYYEQCSTFRHFEHIKTPTVILMSKDDPFIPWEPYLNAKSNPMIDLHLNEHGGHMGYLARGATKWSYRRWLDDALKAVLQRAPGFI